MQPPTHGCGVHLLLGPELRPAGSYGQPDCVPHTSLALGATGRATGGPGTQAPACHVPPTSCPPPAGQGALRGAAGGD